MTRTAPDSPAASAAPPNTDGRDGRLVGNNNDNALESLGKAIVAPIAGADEDGEPAGDEKKPHFADLAPTLPEGRDATDDPAAPPARPWLP